MRKTITLLAVVAFFGPAPARADLILAFAPDGSITNFSVPVGQTVQIPVYIVERNQAPFTTTLTDLGLLSGGVQISYAHSIPGGATALSASSNPGFDSNFAGFPFVNNPAGTAGVSAGTTGAAVFPVGTPPSILVGTFNFQGNTAGDVVTIATMNPHPPTFAEFTNGVFPNFVQLETQPYANIFWAAGNTAIPVVYGTTLTVTPEPTMLLVLGVPAAAFVAWRRKAVRGLSSLPACTE